jgi:hypothetical protein
LSNPKKVFSRALPRSFLDWYSACSLNLSGKYLSQNLAHSIPPWPSKTENSARPLSNYGETIWASSIFRRHPCIPEAAYLKPTCVYEACRLPDLVSFLVTGLSR